MNTSKFRLLFLFFKYIPKAKFRCWDFISTSFQKHEGKLSPKRQPFLCFHPQTSARLLSRFTPLAHQTHQLFTPPAGPACGPRAALQPTMPMSPCCPPVAMPRSATSLRPPPRFYLRMAGDPPFTWLVFSARMGLHFARQSVLLCEGSTDTLLDHKF